MKKALILFAAPVILFIASCGGPKVEEEVILPGMMKVEFSVAGDVLSMIIPDSTKGKLDIVEQSWGATEIKIGSHFQISVEQLEGDVPLVKSDIDGDDVFELQQYIIDKPSIIFWEAKIPIMPSSNFHFYSVSQVANKSYIMKDIECGLAYTEAEVQTMVDASKTLKIKNTPKKEH